MKVIYALLMILLVSGCSLGGKKAVDKIYYRFPEPIISVVKNVHLLVKRPSALGILGGRPMVAQNSDGGLSQMQHNFWLESPKILLQNYLTTLFQIPADSESATGKLNVQILHLEKKQEQALLELKFEIKNQEGDIIFSQTYKEQKKMSENSIPSFVISTAESLNEIVQQFIDDLK